MESQINEDFNEYMDLASSIQHFSQLPPIYKECNCDVGACQMHLMIFGSSDDGISPVMSDSFYSDDDESNNNYSHPLSSSIMLMNEVRDLEFVDVALNEIVNYFDDTGDNFPHFEVIPPPPPLPSAVDIDHDNEPVNCFPPHPPQEEPFTTAATTIAAVAQEKEKVKERNIVTIKINEKNRMKLKKARAFGNPSPSFECVKQKTPSALKDLSPKNIDSFLFASFNDGETISRPQRTTFLKRNIFNKGVAPLEVIEIEDDDDDDKSSMDFVPETPERS